MIDESKYSVTVLCIAHWLFERSVADEESPEVRQHMLDTEDDHIQEIADGLQQLKQDDEDHPVFRAIHSEYMRQKPWFDGKWWHEGRPWNMTRVEWNKLFEEQMQSHCTVSYAGDEEPEFEDDLPFSMTSFSDKTEGPTDSTDDTKEDFKYPPYILRAVRSNLGYDENDDSHDEEIYGMNKDEVLEAVCNWDGLIHYGNRIKGWIESIYGINLNEINETKTKEISRTGFFS